MSSHTSTLITNSDPMTAHGSPLIDPGAQMAPEPCPDCHEEHANADHVVWNDSTGETIWQGCAHCWARRTRSTRPENEVKAEGLREAAQEWSDDPADSDEYEIHLWLLEQATRVAQSGRRTRPTTPGATSEVPTSRPDTPSTQGIATQAPQGTWDGLAQLAKAATALRAVLSAAPTDTTKEQ